MCGDGRQPLELGSGHNRVKDKPFPPGIVKVSKWEWKPFSSKNVKYLPVGGQNLFRWEGEGEMFPSGKGYLCPQEKGESFPVGEANISHTHRKTLHLRLKKARKW